MGFARNALLWVSDNPKLRQTLPQYAFIRRAVRRFMPGEELADALGAAGRLRGAGINTVLTRLGENISQQSEADNVRDHYIHALDEISSRGFDTSLSVKLTQLGMDQGEEVCLRNLSLILEDAVKHKNMVWIDMEQSRYVDRTISIYRKARAGFTNVGLCMQAYLYRTEKDLQNLLPLGPAIRLVKGAYAEPASVAYRQKSGVDRNYLRLASILLEDAKERSTRVGIATHDPSIIRWVIRKASDEKLPRDSYEFQLLYGIRTEDQLRLARQGHRTRVLISYGTFWFPWYVRRLAERPANVLFVLRNLMIRSRIPV